MAPRQVPIIDLQPFLEGSADDRARVGRRVAEALERVGFIVVVNHGLPTTVLGSAAAAGRAFFDAPEAEKLALETVPEGLPRGYLPFGRVSLANTFEGAERPPDIKESFAVGPARLAQNRWPRQDDVFRASMLDCYEAMERVMESLLHVFATALELPIDFFDDKFEGHDSTLRIFNYPAQATPPRPGQLRAGAHTDYGALTILRVEPDVPGGLQVRTPEGEWEDVEAPNDSLVINVGDLLMMWTNDVWLSNVHRVVNPPLGHGEDGRRQSIAFFGSPRAEVRIECIESCRGPDRPARYPPVSAGEHRMSKVRASAPTGSPTT